VDKIRVLLANHPVMIPDDVRTLVERQLDMEIVGDCRGPMNILREVGRTKADAVIFMQAGSAEPGLCSQLIAVYPDLTIMGIAPDMKAAVVQQLRVQRRQLMLPQNENLIAALCTAVRTLS
jgi:DNA-binding NarL/FixJ family response regulator